MGLRGVTLMMAKLAPSAFTWVQLTLPCHPDTSNPCGCDLLSRLAGLAAVMAKMDAEISVEYFMVILGIGMELGF